MQKSPYSRATSTALHSKRRRQWLRLAVVGALVIGATVLAGYVWPSGKEIASTQPELTLKTAGALEAAPASTPAAPPCPYCNQRADLWQTQTAVPPPEVGGVTAAVVEGKCGTLIYGKDENERLPPASLAKIATAIVVAENARMDAPVDIKLNGWDLSAEDESTIMGLEAGMNLPVEDLLYGLLLPSGNDAALALADHIGGTARVVRQMNQLVERMGLRNSRFANVDGRDAEGQYSSAFDMALLGRELMAKPALKTIVGTVSYTPHWERHLLWNANYMLIYYPGSTGVKIGYTETANFTVVTSAERDGRELYIGVLGSWNNFLDSAKLLDWAFENTGSTC